MAKLHILPRGVELSVAAGTNLLDALRVAGLAPAAPCGGNGTCGKCRVTAEGKEVLACRTAVHVDMTVTVPETAESDVLKSGVKSSGGSHRLAIDIGTTSVVCFLLDGATGTELARSSMHNPQAVFGADVISRIRAALDGEMETLTGLIREGVTMLIRQVCTAAEVSPDSIGVVSVVGNPAMQQLFLGISPENLAGVPFAPVLTEAKTVPCGEVLPICPHAMLLVVPDISGYIGADTVGCVLSTELYKKDEMTLLVDIGTNGEMVLGTKDRMIACATAAGPALESANIQCGMRAEAGAIGRVWLEDGAVKCAVIGGGEAKGIRGRIRNPEHIFHLTENVYLTQEDIRQVQMAKGAIHAGIQLMARQMGIQLTDIKKVLLAGAFGSNLDPRSACRMGLLPEELVDRIEAVGNAAGDGAKLLARDEKLLPMTRQLCDKIEFLELASLPDFPRTFAKAMNFREGIQ